MVGRLFVFFRLLFSFHSRNLCLFLNEKKKQIYSDTDEMPHYKKNQNNNTKAKPKRQQ